MLSSCCDGCNRRQLLPPPEAAAAGGGAPSSSPHRHRPDVDGLQKCLGLASLLMRTKPKPLERPCRAFPVHDFGALHRTECAEGLFQILIAERVRQVAYVKFVAHKQNSSKKKRNAIEDADQNRTKTRRKRTRSCARARRARPLSRISTRLLQVFSGNSCSIQHLCLARRRCWVISRLFRRCFCASQYFPARSSFCKHNTRPL